MATTLFLNQIASGSYSTSAAIHAYNHGSYRTGVNTARSEVSFSASERLVWAFRTAQFGGGPFSNSINTIGSATALEARWFYSSPPIASSVTVSGSMTFNIWAYESSMSANAAINLHVMKVTPDGTISNVIATSRTTELGTSTAVANWSATPSSVSFAKGDRILVAPFIRNVGTMGDSYQIYFSTNGTSGNDGDTYVTFTETITFQSVPTGTSVYLTTESTGINPGAGTELKAWTSAGSGGSTAIAVSTSTEMSGIQLKVSGTEVDWYTQPLVSGTLSGTVFINYWQGQDSPYGSYNGLNCEISITNEDGTSPVFWGKNIGLNYYSSGSLLWLSVCGYDASITDGQRIRIRFLLDETGQVVPYIAGTTTTLYFAGSTPDVSGDTYLTFPITLTEYGGGGGSGQMPYSGGGYYPS